MHPESFIMNAEDALNDSEGTLFPEGRTGKKSFIFFEDIPEME
jgi:hypothetical protein